MHQYLNVFHNVIKYTYRNTKIYNLLFDELGHIAAKDSWWKW